MGTRKFVGKVVLIGGAILLARHLYYRAKERKNAVVGNFFPLVDRINVTSAGVLTEQYSFLWDDDERCIQAKSVKFDSLGKVTEQKILEYEHYEDRILVAEKNEEEGEITTFSVFTLNELGMVSGISNRFIDGEEQYVEMELNGSELTRVSTGEESSLLRWEKGNLMSITTGDICQEMTYYKKIENHLFPDINLLSQGLTSEVPLTYLLGTKSRNYLRTLVCNSPDFHEQSYFSYFLDHFARPVQVLMETTTVRPTGTEVSNKEFEITYKKI